MPRLDYEVSKAYRREWGKRNREKLRVYMQKWMGYPEPTRPCPEKCEACGRPPSSNKGLALDHDHVTGKFRGWLCDLCNRGIGQLGDNLEGVKKALEYLERAL